METRIAYNGLTYTLVEVISTSLDESKILDAALKAAGETRSSVFGYRVTNDTDEDDERMRYVIRLDKD